jgi:hypothetical protein
MQHKIYLNDDNSDLLKRLSSLSGLTDSELINRQLSAHQAEGHELLALVDAHPELLEQAANLLQSYGPEPLMVGIKAIAPKGYLTLGERFERELNRTLYNEQTDR